MLTPKEIATELKVKEQTVMKWLREGTLKGVKLGKLWRVKEEDYKKFIEQGMKEDEQKRMKAQFFESIKKRGLDYKGGDKNENAWNDTNMKNLKKGVFEYGNCRKKRNAWL